MIPILLAGLAGYAMSNPRRRRTKNSRRNPHARYWRIADIIASTATDSEKLHELDKLIPRVASEALITQYKTLFADKPIKVFRAALKPYFQEELSRHRRNPLSLDAVAMPAANLLWRKHGYQSPGHAEDLAMMARRGTAAAKLWARVAQITKSWLYSGKKRSNPPRGLSKEALAYLRINKRARAAHDRHDWREADRLQTEAMAHYRKASVDEQQAIKAAELTGMMKGVAKALFSRRKR